ncbi:conjugated polyketone reductase C1 [Cystobasidium minutum MCA 4210]|uniref:conjugated polyketone reductase C1 n=1 Tax=Cystobasidium minutum MCA 4210 TaxID=1397322 RepID=UPI0034CF93F5|eukprot:jgi/Rhomi1/146804/e_gw1.7.253.1
MAGHIDTVKLNDGSSIPWLGFGNGSGNAKKAALISTKAALENSLYHIDTAQLYGTEEATMEAIKELGIPREQCYITSKIATAHGSDAEIRAGIEETHQRMGTIPDLFLIHNPFIGHEDRIVPTWKVMEAMKDEGKLKSIGVSNFRPQDFEKILAECKHKPSVHQIEFHPLVLKHLEPVLAIHKEHNIITEAYGPLTASLRFPKERKNPLEATLQKISERLTKEAGEEVNDHAVTLLWVKAKGGVAVTSSGNPENIKGLARISRLKVALTPEEVAEIDSIGSQYHFRYYNEHMSKNFPVPDLPKDHILPGRNP